MKRIMICLCLLGCCCSNDGIKREMHDFIGSNIAFPADMEVFPEHSIRLSAGPKLVIYVDSASCTSCSIRHLTNDMDSLKRLPIPILPIIVWQKGGQRELDSLIAGGEHRFPLIIDRKNSFRRANRTLPDDRRCHTFLLDRNDRVTLIGNPLASDAMWDLFRSTLDNMLAHDGEYVLQ